MHELGLASVGTLPPAVMVDTLQQLCLATGTADATALPARLAKHLRAFAALPELERFVDAVCEVCCSQTTGLPGHASRHSGPFSTLVTGQKQLMHVPLFTRLWTQYISWSHTSKKILGLRSALAR